MSSFVSPVSCRGGRSLSAGAWRLHAAVHSCCWGLDERVEMVNGCSPSAASQGTTSSSEQSGRGAVCSERTACLAQICCSPRSYFIHSLEPVLRCLIMIKYKAHGEYLNSLWMLELLTEEESDQLLQTDRIGEQLLLDVVTLDSVLKNLQMSEAGREFRKKLRDGFFSG